jgi:hypothetical protein
MASAPDITGATERLSVAVGLGMHEHISVQTSFNVKRYDAEMTEWAQRKLGYGDHLAPLPGSQGLTPEQFASVGIFPYLETQEDDCNLIVQNGWVALLGGVAGTTMSPKFGAANGRIGAGTSSTAAAFSQTTLVGDTGAASTTSYFKLVSGAPTISTASAPATLVFTAAFGTAVANFAWNEFGTDAGTADSVSNATTGGTFFNRGVSAQGTKASGQTWTATETISFGFPSGAGTVS